LIDYFSVQASTSVPKTFVGLFYAEDWAWWSGMRSTDRQLQRRDRWCSIRSTNLEVNSNAINICLAGSARLFWFDRTRSQIQSFWDDSKRQRHGRLVVERQAVHYV